MKRSVIKTVVMTSIDLGPAEPHQYVPTVKVRRNKDGLIMTINKGDLGSDKYPDNKYTLVEGSFEDTDDDDDVATPVAPPPKKNPNVSSFTREQLVDMNKEQLKALPEYKLMSKEDAKTYKTKDQFIDAVLKIREQQETA